MRQDTTRPENERTWEEQATEIAGDERLSATDAVVDFFKQYSRERPEVVALWAFGIGFVLGWKLKPW